MMDLEAVKKRVANSMPLTWRQGAALVIEVERLTKVNSILARAVLDAHEPETLDEVCAEGGAGTGFVGHACACEACEIAAESEQP